LRERSPTLSPKSEDQTPPKPAKPAPQSDSIEERRRREAEALRQNLLRRKAQTRARRDPKP